MSKAKGSVLSKINSEMSEDEKEQYRELVDEAAKDHLYYIFDPEEISEIKELVLCC